ncbi:unnamed protein product [Chrysoparadoxa australica]
MDAAAPHMLRQWQHHQPHPPESSPVAAGGTRTSGLSQMDGSMGWDGKEQPEIAAGGARPSGLSQMDGSMGWDGREQPGIAGAPSGVPSAEVQASTESKLQVQLAELKSQLAQVAIQARAEAQAEAQSMIEARVGDVRSQLAVAVKQAQASSTKQAKAQSHAQWKLENELLQVKSQVAGLHSHQAEAAPALAEQEALVRKDRFFPEASPGAAPSVHEGAAATPATTAAVEGLSKQQEEEQGEQKEASTAAARTSQIQGVSPVDARDQSGGDAVPPAVESLMRGISDNFPRGASEGLKLSTKTGEEDLKPSGREESGPGYPSTRAMTPGSPQSSLSVSSLESGSQERDTLGLMSLRVMSPRGGSPRRSSMNQQAHRWQGTPSSSRRASYAGTLTLPSRRASMKEDEDRRPKEVEKDGDNEKAVSVASAPNALMLASIHSHTQSLARRASMSPTGGPSLLGDTLSTVPALSVISAHPRRYSAMSDVGSVRSTGMRPPPLSISGHSSPTRGPLTPAATVATKANTAALRPDPSLRPLHGTATVIQVICAFNVIFSIAYLWWRIGVSMGDVDYLWYSIFFLAGEIVLTIGVWTSHASRMFPSVRPFVVVDDMIEEVQDKRFRFSPRFSEAGEILSRTTVVAILVPTAGEKLGVVLQALLGCLSQRLWKPARGKSARDQLRILVLDEKRRGEVCQLLAWVYSISELLADEELADEIMGAMDLDTHPNPMEFWEFYVDHRYKNLEDHDFSLGVLQCLETARCIEDLIHSHDDKFAIRSSNLCAATARRNSVGSVVDSSSVPKASKLEPGHLQIFDRCPEVPTALYFTRKMNGTPKVSPKAGNMNTAVFNLDNPDKEPLIGDAKLVVVNDARHQLMPEFLQRMVPYFFELRPDQSSYRWGDVAFVQAPQRFIDLKHGDPMSNHAYVNFFVSNVGKDGIGGVASCGQGSIWRVDALHGMRQDGSMSLDWKKEVHEVGKKFGFRAEVLIEDTHTSMELFMEGWRSAYVAELDEVLAICTQPPDTVRWRIKQIFRWHIGAVQLLFHKGLLFLIRDNGARWPSHWHRVFCFNSLTYYFQSFGGQVLLAMPIIYGVLQVSPFDTHGVQFPLFFFPYIITAVAPTAIAMNWKGVQSTRVVNDEQFWLSTTYVECWTVMKRGYEEVTVRLGLVKSAGSWGANCPVWPIVVYFLLEVVAICLSTFYWMKGGFAYPWVWVSSLGATLLVMHLLWPVFSTLTGEW